MQIGDILIMAFLIAALIFIIVAPSYIVFRNIPLKGFPKYLYSFSVVPLFIILMVVNFRLLSKGFPSFTDWSLGIATKAQKPPMPIAIILTMPVPIAGLYVFYKILHFIQ